MMNELFCSCSEWGLLSACGVQVLTAVASLVAELGVLGIWASVVSHGFSFFRACGIFLDQGLNLYFLH